MIRIHGVPASRTARCIWMLEELGLDYENVPTHFLGEAQKPEHLQLNPNGKIPVLDDGGTVVWESMAINIYLARKYGKGGLWPEPEADQAHTIQWSFWAMTEVEPPLMKLLLNRTFAPEDQRDEAEALAGEEELRKPLAVLERTLRDRDYLLGAEFGTADLDVCSVLSWVTTMGKMDLSDFPNVSRWLASCTSRPALSRVFGG